MTIIICRCSHLRVSSELVFASNFSLRRRRRCWGFLIGRLQLHLLLWTFNGGEGSGDFSFSPINRWENLVCDCWAWLWSPQLPPPFLALFLLSRFYYFPSSHFSHLPHIFPIYVVSPLSSSLISSISLPLPLPHSTRFLLFHRLLVTSLLTPLWNREFWDGRQQQLQKEQLLCIRVCVCVSVCVYVCVHATACSFQQAAWAGLIPAGYQTLPTPH